jgi:uncharacterized membrane protein YedE/YeeE
MMFRLIGLLLTAAAFLLLWFARPTREGKLRVRKTYEPWLAVLVAGLIGLGMVFLAFGAPGFASPGSTQ